MDLYFGSKRVELHEENDVLLLLHYSMHRILNKNNIRKKQLKEKDIEGSQRQHLPSRIKENEHLSKKIVPNYVKHMLDNNVDKNKIAKELRLLRNDIKKINNRLHYEIQKLDLLTL